MTLRPRAVPERSAGITRNAESGIGAWSPLSPHHRNGGRRPQSRPAFPETLWVLYHTPARRAPCLDAKTGLFTICSQTTKAGRVSPFQRRNGGRRPAARTSRLPFSPAGSVVASSFGRGVHWTPATRSALLLCRGVHRTPSPSAPSHRHKITSSPLPCRRAVPGCDRRTALRLPAGWGRRGEIYIFSPPPLHRMGLRPGARRPRRSGGRLGPPPDRRCPPSARGRNTRQTPLPKKTETVVP